MNIALAFVICVLAALVCSTRSQLSGLSAELRALRRDFEALLRELERRGGHLGDPSDAALPSPVPGPAPEPPPTPIARPHEQPFAPPIAPLAQPSPWRPAGLSLESFVGGRLLLVAGIVVVLCGLGFFLKYAFDHDWIRPPVRIGLGVAIGLAALLAGDRLRGQGLRAFGHAIMGGGLGALYLSNYFAAVRYGFVGRPMAFVFAAAITALGAGLAVWRDARLLAHLGLLGGFLAPALLGTNVDALEPLAGWLLVLDLGVLVVLWRRAWPGLDLLALSASVLYFGSWRARFLAPEREAAAALVIAALAVALLFVALAPSILARRRVLSTSLVTALAAGLLGYVAAHELLHPERSYVLGASVVALAMLYFLGGRLFALRVPADTGARESLDVFGLAALATAVPLLLRGHAVAPAWAFAGVAVVALWRSYRLRGFDVGGVALVLLALGNLLLHHWPMHDGPFTPFFNGAFLAFASPCVALCACGWLLRRDPERAQPAGILFAAGVWLLVPLLAIECWQHFSLGRERYGERALEYAQAAVAVALSGYASIVAWLARRGGERAEARAAGGGSALASVPLLGALLAGVELDVAGHRLAFTPGLNLILLAGVAAVAMTLVVAGLTRGTLRQVALHGGLCCGLLLLWGEFHAYAELLPHEGSREDIRFQAQLWISVAWALYAATLIGLGFRRRSVDLRWAGLAAFAITLTKVFLADMAGLSAAYRIGSFLVLGVLLLAASYLYQRTRAAD